jgi:hypothetical protein
MATPASPAIFRVVTFMVYSDVSIHVSLVPAKIQAREASTADAIRGSA